MGDIVSYMSNIPEENWERAFKKDLVDSSNGKTTVSKTVVLGSSPSQSADGGWVNEMLDNQGMTNEC